jgi:secretion/DNA translocation related CpaE-like protein
MPAGAFVDALPGEGDLVVLSWDRGRPIPMPTEAMGAALDAGRRGRDFIVGDLPRQLDQAAVCVLDAADLGYLVVPAEVRACAAAARVAAVVLPHCPVLRLVVRQPASGGLPATAVADAVGLPLAGVMRTEPAIRSAMERGDPPVGSGRGALAALCDELIASITTDPMAAAA